MQAFIIALLLSIATFAHADSETAPKPYSCAQAKADGDQILVLACAKMAKDTRRVKMTFPVASTQKPRTQACGDTVGNCAATTK